MIETPLAIAAKRVAQAFGGKRAFKAAFPELYWQLQVEIGRDEAQRHKAQSN